LAGFIRNRILAPVLDFSRGPKIFKYVSELEESQWWPRAKILELQDERLRRLVEYAYHNVPYYRRIFDERSLKPPDIASSADLVKLPVLTKKLIRANFDQLTARALPRREMVLAHTGGSTGEPLLFYTTRDERRNWAVAKMRRVGSWWGYEVGDRRAVVTRKRPRISLMEKLRQFLEGGVYFEARDMGKKVPFWVRRLEELQPKFILGYPSAIYILAKSIEGREKVVIRPRAVVTFSEQLYDFQKELFERVFKCEVYSNYGSWETNQIAADCSEHSGYHIAAESVIVEVADDKGIPLPAGDEGRILITNLHNYAMPFIRYDIGDVGALSDEVCPCGRGLPLLARLAGRTTDFIVLPRGDRISGMALAFRFLASENVEHFQVLQESRDKVTVRVVLTGDCRAEYKDELAAKIVGQYRPVLGDAMNISVQFVDRIETTREGKRRLVVSKLAEGGGLDSGLSQKDGA